MLGLHPIIIRVQLYTYIIIYNIIIRVHGLIKSQLATFIMSLIMMVRRNMRAHSIP